MTFKTITLPLIFFAANLLLALPSHAALINYVFTGTVTGVDDGAGIIEETFSLSDPTDLIGTSVEYVFLVDFDSAGTRTFNNGTIETFLDSPSTDYFFADYVSGALIDEKDGGILNAATDVFESNNGTNDTFFIGTPGALNGRSQDNQLQIFSQVDFVSNWIVGTPVFGQELANASDNSRSIVNTELQLTEISPVPLPATAWLFGCAIIAAGVAARRRKNA